MTTRRVLVLYASETGCAQDYAEELGREGRKLYLDMEVLPMDDYNVLQLPQERFVFFVVATTGQGDMPANAVKFWRFLLRKNLPRTSLSSLRAALCGLGDSGYKEFNFAAKKLYRRLLQLSTKFIIEPAYGDDQSAKGPYQVLDPWKERLLSIVETLFPLPEGKQKRGNELLPSKYIVQTCRSKPNQAAGSVKKQTETSKEYNQQNPYIGTLLCNKRLTAEDWQQDVRHYEISLDSSMEFQPGDSLAVLPCNSTDEVMAFLKRVNIPVDTVITSIALRDPSATDSGPRSISHLTFPMTVVELFEKHIDITGTPRRYFFELLSFFASAEHEQERLLYFSSSEAQDELRVYCDREKKSVREVLEDFPSVLPPLEYILDLVPPIQPRLFSIASSWKLHPNQAQLLVAKLQFTTTLKRKRVGLCTGWMSQLQEKDSLRVWIKEGNSRFRLPEKATTPIIMIGPGTGLAPFRSFIQERTWMMRNGENLGWSSLYTGCRHRLKDWYYGDELNAAVTERSLTKYYIAFSRDEIEINNRKTYVQHLMQESSVEIWEVLRQGGFVFLSGSAQVMPQNVKDAIIEIIQREGNQSQEDAEVFFAAMERSGRFSSETWQ